MSPQSRDSRIVHVCVEKLTRYSQSMVQIDKGNVLNLNQVRVLTPYVAYARDKAAFRKNLVHLVRACHQRGIGVMITPMWPRSETPTESPLSREWAADLVNTIGN